MKPRLLGHWGTTPGLNLIYVHLNRVITQSDLNVMYVIGPGHGGPGIVANTYLEGTYSEIYPGVSQDERGIDVRLRADHAGSWRELNRGDIDRMRAAGVCFEWSRPWSFRHPFALNRRNHRKLLAAKRAVTACAASFTMLCKRRSREYGPLLHISYPTA